MYSCYELDRCGRVVGPVSLVGCTVTSSFEDIRQTCDSALKWRNHNRTSVAGAAVYGCGLATASIDLLSGLYRSAGTVYTRCYILVLYEGVLLFTSPALSETRLDDCGYTGVIA